MKDFLIIFPERCREVLFPAPVHPAGFDFVISRPDDDARMISQSLDVINRLLPHVVEKLLRAGIHTPSEHEIIPDQNPHLIAELIEVVTLVNTSTPHPHHVHIRIANRFHQLTAWRSADAGREAVCWNPIAPLGENGNAVDDEFETLSLPIHLLS